MSDDVNVVLTANTAPYQQSVDQAADATNRMIDTVNKLTMAIDGAFRSAGRTMQIGGASMIAGITAAGFAAGRLEQQMSQLQASMTMVSKTQDEYTSKMTAYGKAVTNLRQDFGQTSQEAINLASQLQRMGQASQNIDQLSNSFTRLSAISGEGVNGLVQNMIQLQRMMGTEGVTQTKVFNATLAEISQNAGASATGILQFSQQIAPVAKVAGLTQKEIMGVSTAFVKSGADGYAAANAFNKMLTDITRSIQYGSPELAGYANLIGVSVEQFKQMPRTEAITKIFENINKQGPDAIKTLDRFGLDGIRTLKSIQAVAGTGGIRQAVANAMGGGDQQLFDQASNRAFDGLNDQLKKMAENGKMIAEAFGQGVLPVMNKIAQAINGVLAPMTSMMQMFGSIPGGAAILGGAALLTAGTVTRMFTGLSALGIARGGYKTLSGGFQAGRGIGLDSAEEATYQARQAGLPAEGNFLQHYMYGAARFAGRNYQNFADENPDGVGPAGRLKGFGRRIGTFGVTSLGSLLGAGLDPLSTRALNNNFDRDQRYQLFRSSSPGEALGWNRMKEAWGNREEGSGLRGVFQAAKNYEHSLNLSADSTREYSTTTRAVIGESKKFASALTQASFNTVRLGASGAAALGARGLGSLANNASGVINALGGPIGLGMTAISAGGVWAYNQYQQGQERMQAAMQAPDSRSPFSVYAAAVGEAAAATKSFTEVLKESKNVVGGYTARPSAELVDQVAKSAADYTNPLMKNATMAEAKSLAASVMSGNPSDATKQALQGDLLRRFGTDARGIAQVSAIMQTSSNASRLDLTPQFSQAFNLSSPFAFGISQEGANAGQSVGNGIGEMMRNTGANTNEAARILLSTTNQGLRTANQNRNIFGRTNKGARLDAVAQGIVTAALGKAGRPEDIAVVADALSKHSDPIDVQNAIAESDTEIGKAFSNAVSAVGPNYNRRTTELPNTRSYATSWTGSGVEPSVLNLLRQQTPAARTGSKLDIRAPMNQSNAVSDAIFGAGPMATQASSAVFNAMSHQENLSAQWTGMQQMGETAIQITGSFRGAIAAIDQMKAAAGDAASPLYQLANSARGYVRQRQSEAMNYMTTAQVAGELRGNYETDLRTDLNNPTAESGANREQSRQALEQFIAQTKDRLRSYALQVREFNVSRSRGEEDFARQQQYNLEDYNRSREYAQEDFNRSRMRAEEDFQHQVVVLTRNTARTMTNIYERMNVQRTWSASNLLQNMRDQQTRLDEQQANLRRLRRAGLSGDAISQMSLNDPSNIQQLARLTDDLLSNPKQIEAFNRAARSRNRTARSLVTDKDNEQWREMSYNFKKNMARGEADFQRGMDRQAEQFGIQFDRMQKQYQLSIDRAGEDLNRSMEEITNNFNELADTALDTLTGTSKKQMNSLLSTLGYTRNQIYTMSTGLVSDLNKLFMSLGISVGGTPTVGGKKLMVGTVTMPDGSRVNAGQYAGGGEIPGQSSHKREDNVPIMATAGEYMQPVDSVQYYGKNFMDALRDRRVPRGAVQGLASGGMVYQQMEDWLSKNIPSAVVTSDYRPGAITALGNVSMHAKGKAVDLAPSMETFNKILSAFGSKIYQLFYSPADGRTILRGKPWHMDPVTKGDHWNHVHWAMESMNGLAGAAGWDGTFQSLLSMVRGVSGVGKFNRLMTNHPVKGLAGYGNGWLAQAVTAAAMDRVGSGGAGIDVGYSSGGGDIRSLVQSMAARRGWTGNNWNDLAQLIAHESSWNPRAQNPSSSAYGLFQFLDSTWKSVGGSKTSDPTKQAEYGLKYIAQRYGDPSKAWKFWNSHTPHWYGDGAVFNGARTIGVGERGPEAVMPLSGKGVDFVWELMKRNSTEAQRAMVAANGVPMRGSTVNYYSRIDKSTQITGDITVVSNDPDDMLRKLEAKKRMEALKGRH